MDGSSYEKVFYYIQGLVRVKTEKSPKFSFLTTNLVLFVLRPIIFHHSTMFSHKKWMVPAIKRFFVRYKDLYVFKRKITKIFIFDNKSGLICAGDIIFHLFTMFASSSKSNFFGTS